MCTHYYHLTNTVQRILRNKNNGGWYHVVSFTGEAVLTTNENEDQQIKQHSICSVSHKHRIARKILLSGYIGHNEFISVCDQAERK